MQDSEGVITLDVDLDANLDNIVKITKNPLLTLKKLYVDALNVSGQLGFTKKAWSITVPQREVERFVKACRDSGWEPTVFIDAGIESNEALEKWKTRRVQEVKDAVRDVPHAMSSLMGDIFRQNGVTVHYSPWNVDNDDCLAFFAQRDGAAILSNDLDFARYKGKTYEQFGSFNVHEGRLFLNPKKIDERRLPTPRDFLTAEPKMVQDYPGFVYLKENGKYVRGSPSFATKFYGNFHGHVKPLRYLLYTLMKLDTVEELWPEFGDNSESPEVVWAKNTFVSGEKTMEYCPIEEYYRKTRDTIFNPVLAIPNFTNDEKWNFEMAIMLVIAEIYAVIAKTSTLTQFQRLYDATPEVLHWLHTWKPDFESNVPSVCRNWKAEGVCKFGDKCIASGGHFVCDCWRGEKCRYRH
jgi:hypothetical protein